MPASYVDSKLLVGSRLGKSAITPANRQGEPREGRILFSCPVAPHETLMSLNPPRWSHNPDVASTGKDTQEEDSQVLTLTLLLSFFSRLAGNHNQTVLR